jgi:hypothetical protein
MSNLPHSPTHKRTNGRDKMKYINFPTEEARWIWLAGVMDCDSYIGISKSSSHVKRGFHYTVRIAFEQKSKIVIKQIKKILNNAGQINPNQNIYWRYYVPTSNARKILPNVIPYLLKKKKQTILILEALNLLSQHRKNYTPHDKRLEEIYQELHSLNEKGRKKNVVYRSK